MVEAPAAIEPVQALGFTETGAIGSMAADGASKTINTDVNLSGKVALFQQRVFAGKRLEPLIGATTS